MKEEKGATWSTQGRTDGITAHLARALATLTVRRTALRGSSESGAVVLNRLHLGNRTHAGGKRERKKEEKKKK